MEANQWVLVALFLDVVFQVAPCAVKLLVPSACFKSSGWGPSVLPPLFR
jgi:hypothetical protein